MGKNKNKNKNRETSTSEGKPKLNGVAKKSKEAPLVKAQNEAKPKLNGVAKKSKEASVVKAQNEAKPSKKDKKKLKKAGGESAAAVKPTAPKPQETKPVVAPGKKVEKKKKKNNANKDESAKQAPKPQEAKASVEGGEAAEKPLLGKRAKNRLKTQLKKDLILKGKTNVLLDNVKMLEKKLLKLKAKPEPHSMKAQRKMAMIQAVLDKAKGGAAPKKSSDEAVPSPEKAKKKKKKSKENKPPQETEADTVAQNESKIPTNDFIVFVGNLPLNINKSLLREHFKDVEGLEKIRIPKPKKSHKRGFAYLQFASDAARQKALEKHQSELSGMRINVMHADRKSGKKKNAAKGENEKLVAQRKAVAAAAGVAARLTDEQSAKIGKELKKKKRNKKKSKVGELQKKAEKV